tara:strand:- start:2330 stop:2572 length:243 start_codon:yes stop_codon:yes gene_type:complete
MKLTYSDLAHLYPRHADQPKKKRVKKKYNWIEVNQKYGGNTVAHISKKTGIHKSTIYKACERGLINIENVFAEEYLKSKQ